MRGLLLGTVMVGMAWAVPTEAFPLATPGLDNVEGTLLTKVGWRRQYWRHAMPHRISTLHLMGITRRPIHTRITRPHAATTRLCRMAAIP